MVFLQKDLGSSEELDAGCSLMLHKSAALYCVDDAGKHSLRVHNRAVFYVLRMSCIDLQPDLCAEVCVV